MKLSAEQFKRIHDSAKSTAQALLLTGLSRSAYSMRVARYRKAGIILKQLDDRKIDVNKVNAGGAK